MNNKIIEIIRKILIRTVLPMRKKADELLRKFYLSIAFRIAFYYVRLFIVYGVLFFIVIYALYVRLFMSKYNSWADSLVDRLQSGQAVLAYEEPTDIEERYKEYARKVYEEAINPYQSQGITIQIKNSSENQIVYEDLKEDVEEDKSILNMLSYNYKENRRIIFKKYRTYSYNGEEYKIYLQFDITESINTLHRFILLLILIYLVFISFVGRNGEHGIARLLQPIKNMSATANRLTVNNLNSERLSVSGTKNELKELAGTINSMLDRIELSYESQKQFVSDASHELRTPIAVIQGYANMLERWGMEDKEVLKESVDAIANEAKSMKELVEKLLFLSRHDKKTLRLNRKVFNMRDVVEEMIRETQMVEKNRVISSPILEDVSVYGDQQALKQALRIFIDNAIKYSKDGDSIYIGCRNKNGTCIVSIKDTGIGMKREDMDRIFERFYRADTVRNGGVDGHGLGLSIAKLIVLNHTGTIKVKSQYTKGSTFTIILPDYYRKGLVKLERQEK
ncbi:MAG: HAMP domain-containing sensor histidine kinase [bacterium]|nr:HAMP domain-containing sensor histidine kinase [bacterium]